MGCNCGGGKRKRAAGTVPADPMIFGEDSDELPVRRVALVSAVNGVPAGATRYVRGSLTDSMIVNGLLRLLEG